MIFLSLFSHSKRILGLLCIILSPHIIKNRTAHRNSINLATFSSYPLGNSIISPSFLHHFPTFFRDLKWAYDSFKPYILIQEGLLCLFGYFHGEISAKYPILPHNFLIFTSYTRKIIGYSSNIIWRRFRNPKYTSHSGNRSLIYLMIHPRNCLRPYPMSTLGNWNPWKYLKKYQNTRSIFFGKLYKSYKGLIT
jgi:hypothetical protein